MATKLVKSKDEQEEEYLRQYNTRRTEEALERVSAQREKSNERNENEIERRKKALESIRRMEWLKNKDDITYVQRRRTELPTQSELHPFQKKELDDYFRGTGKTAKTRDRKKGPIQVVKSLNDLSTTAELPPPPPRNAPPPPPTNAWVQRSGASLFAKATTTAMPYRLNNYNEEAMLAKALKESLEDQQKQLTYRDENGSVSDSEDYEYGKRSPSGSEVMSESTVFSSDRCRALTRGNNSPTQSEFVCESPSPPPNKKYGFGQPAEDEIDYFQKGHEMAKGRAREITKMLEAALAEKTDIAMNIPKKVASRDAEPEKPRRHSTRFSGKTAEPPVSFSPDKTADLPVEDDEQSENASNWSPPQDLEPEFQERNLEISNAQGKEFAEEYGSYSVSEDYEYKKGFSPDKSAELAVDADGRSEKTPNMAQQGRVEPKFEYLAENDLVVSQSQCREEQRQIWTSNEVAVSRDEIQPGESTPAQPQAVEDEAKSPTEISPYDFILEDRESDPSDCNLFPIDELSRESNAAADPYNQFYPYQSIGGNYVFNVPGAYPGYPLHASAPPVLPQPVQESLCLPPQEYPPQTNAFPYYQQLQEGLLASPHSVLQPNPARSPLQPNQGFGLQSGNISNLDPRIFQMSLLLNHYVYSKLGGTSPTGSPLTLESLAAMMPPLPKVPQTPSDDGFKPTLLPPPPPLQQDFGLFHVPQGPVNPYQSPATVQPSLNYDYNPPTTSSGCTETYPQQLGLRSPANFIRAPVGKGRGQHKPLN